jgi:hypothetical protein
VDWFYLYSIAYLMVVAAVGLGLNLIGFPPRWIVGVMAVLLVLGVLSLFKRSRGDKAG